MKAKTSKLKSNGLSLWVFLESKDGGCLPYFVCDLPAEFGVDNIRRVHHRGVLEVAWLLSVLFLVEEENTKNQL